MPSGLTNCPSFIFNTKRLVLIPIFFAPGTEGQHIHDNVLPLPDEPVIVKHEASSFVHTPLLEELQNKGIDTLILTGMQTNVCVRSTTKDALKHGFKVIVLKEATAALDETTHTSTLKALAKKGATVMSVEELLEELFSCLKSQA